MSDKQRKYETFKSYLQKLNLSYAEYEKCLIEWCKKNKF